MKMGGPWTARVSIDGTELKGEYLLQPAVTDNTETMLALVMPLEEKSFLVSRLRFAVVVVDTVNKKQYLSRETFRYLYIESFANDELICHTAFHNEDAKNKFLLRFDPTAFTTY